MENGGQPPEQVPAPAWASTVRMLQETMGSLSSTMSAMNQALSQNAEIMNASLLSINTSITANAQQMADSLSSNAQQMASSVEQMGNRLGELEDKTKGKSPKNFCLPPFFILFNVSFMFHMF